MMIVWSAGLIFLVIGSRIRFWHYPPAATEVLYSVVWSVALFLLLAWVVMLELGFFSMVLPGI